MKLYHSIERKPQPTVIEEIVGEGGSEAAIVCAAPYFAKENYTRLDKFLFFRNEDADLSPVGSLSVLPTSTVDATRLAITNGSEVSATVLQNAANFFAEKLQSTQRVLPVSTNWVSVTFGNGVFVAVAYGSSIAATSPDGITWTQRVLPVSTNWRSVTFGNGVFVAVVQSSSIAATSPDGITWTQRVLPVSANWVSVTFGNGVFVAVTYGSSIAATLLQDPTTRITETPSNLALPANHSYFVKIT
jgi:hypothetical protein